MIRLRGRGWGGGEWGEERGGGGGGGSNKAPNSLFMKGMGVSSLSLSFFFRRTYSV